jgi:tetratricopeptide (TPR) repeat protein
MNDGNPTSSAAAPSGDELRRQAAEIVQRRKRGLAARHALAPIAEPTPDRARATLVEGRRLFEEGKIAEALIRAEVVIGLAPHGSTVQAEGLILLGDGRLAQGYPQAARASYNRALHIHPGSAEARLKLADVYRRIRQPQRAIPLYIEVLVLIRDPDEAAEVRLDLADTYRAAGRPDAARRVVRISEEVGGLSGTQQVRAARTFLTPDSPVALLMLLIVLALTTWAFREAGALVAFAAFLFGLVLYATIQWWRTPVER